MEEQAVPDKNFWNLLTDGERSSFVWIQDSTIPAKFGRVDGRYEVWKRLMHLTICCRNYQSHLI